MKRTFLFFSLAVLVFPFCATAQQLAKEDPIDASMQQEMAKDPSTAGMRNAANEAREKWDKEMNAAYSRLMSRLSKSQQNALRESQRNWLKFRDSEGTAISEITASKEGTMWQLTATSKGLDLVRDRALQLRAYEQEMDE